MTGDPLDDEDTPSLLPPLGERDDEDDDTVSQLTHAPRGRDALAEHMRAALRHVQAAKFMIVSGEYKGRAAVENAEQALLNAFADMSISEFG